MSAQLLQLRHTHWHDGICLSSLAVDPDRLRGLACSAEFGFESRTPSRLWSASRMVDPSFSHKACCFALSVVWAAAWAVKLTETRQRKKIAFTIRSPARDEMVQAVYRVQAGETSSDMNQRVAKRARLEARCHQPAACSEHGRSRWTESQPRFVRKDQFPFCTRTPVYGSFEISRFPSRSA